MQMPPKCRNQFFSIFFFSENENFNANIIIPAKYESYCSYMTCENNQNTLGFFKKHFVQP